MEQTFRTELNPEDFPFKLSHEDKIVSIGSCFADHLGNKLEYYKFDVLHRPYGVIYSPLPIAHNLINTITGAAFDEKHLVKHNDLWHSLMHHGSFSNPEKEELIKKIELSEKTLKEKLKTASLLIITLGSSYTYFYKKDRSAVANCHKIPASEFERELIPHHKIYTELSKVLKALNSFNPELKILLSVSPVRHLKDGFHENQISKANLLLACDQLTKEHENVFYFPAYELMLDDLRDYRFYSEDMVHPNKTAVEYIWKKWSQAFLQTKSLSLLKEIDNLQKGLAHRPLHPELGNDKNLQKSLLKKIQILKEKEPALDFTQELKQLT